MQSRRAQPSACLVIPSPNVSLHRSRAHEPKRIATRCGNFSARREVGIRLATSNCYACNRDSIKRARGPQPRLDAGRWRSSKAPASDANAPSEARKNPKKWRGNLPSTGKWAEGLDVQAQVVASFLRQDRPCGCG